MSDAIIESAKRILLAVLLFVLVVGTGAAGWFVLFENSPLPGVVPRNTRALTRKTNNFSYDMYARLMETHSQDDFVFSPFVLELGLLMLRSAANEETQAQITRLLYPGATADQANAREEDALALRRALPQLHLASRLWVQRDFDLPDSYLKIANQKFGVMPGLVDFKGAAEAARSKINRWIADRAATENILPPGAIDGLTQFLLTGAIHFESAWGSQFRVDQTEPGEFTLQTGSPISAQFMHNEDTFEYAERPGYKLIELPNEGGELTMLLVLPRDLAGLQPLEATLTPEVVAGWTASLTPRKVAVVLPRFSLEKVLSLPIVLNEMGITDAFHPMHADFSRLTGRRDIYLNSVIHKAALVVKENGGKRADHSMLKLMSDVGGRSAVFRANHPFIFLIRHKKTNTILLMGHLADPRA